MKKLLPFIVLLLFLVSSSSVLAFNRGLVLGEATASPQPVSFSAGPGLILPDSPFYFLDLWRDRLRQLLTINPQERARLGMKIAAERLAELQVMLERNSPYGINLALANLTERIEEAKEITQKQRAAGKEVAALAHDLNEMIDQGQEFLGRLEERVPNETKFLIKAAQTRIAKAEAEIEKELPAEVRKKEEIKELKQGIKEQIKEASQSTLRVGSLSRELEKLTQEPATKPGIVKPKGVEGEMLEEVKAAVESWQKIQEEFRQIQRPSPAK